jgi:hypothetical protein
LKSLGLNDHQAFEKAVHLSQQLPDHLNPDEITLSRTGEWLIAPVQAPLAS